MTSLVDDLVAQITQRPEFLKDRAYFYHLRNAFEAVRAQVGAGAAMGMSAELLERAALIKDDDDRQCFYSRIEGVLSGDYDITGDNNIVSAGPHTGHPWWHLANPWFHVWKAATCIPDLSNNWRPGSAQALPRDQAYVDSLYTHFRETPNLGRDELGKVIADLTAKLGRPPRVFDYGCGYGNWLRWMVEHCGVLPEDAFGFDPLPERVKAAKLMTAPAGIPPLQISADVNRLPNTDLIVLAAVTGCLTDEQLDQTLGQLAVTKPALIFETHSTESCPSWLGRQSNEAAFQRVGYKLVNERWLGDPLTKANLINLAVPLKYFLPLKSETYELAA